MCNVEEKLAKSEEDRKAHPLLVMLPVPLRGTEAWEKREALRASLGNQCLSWGSLDWAERHVNT
jgi:hypothetical protein